MKKTIYALTALLAMTACTIYEDKSDRDYTNQRVSENVHSDYLYPIYDMIQAIHFFNEYQALLNGEYDTDKAYELGVFFGENLNNLELDRNHYYSSSWGGIRKDDAEGEYIAYPRNAVDGHPEFKVVYTDSLTFEISRDWAVDEKRENAEFDFYAKVAYNESGAYPVEISSLLFNYSDTGSAGDLNMVIEETEDLKCNLYSASSSRTYPRTGALHFTISGEYDDWFIITYGSYTGFGGHGYKIEGKYD